MGWRDSTYASGDICVAATRGSEDGEEEYGGKGG